MDFNEFKEQFTEDVKQGLADAGMHIPLHRESNSA